MTVWRTAMDRYVVPLLPDRWRASDWVVHAEPVHWLTRALVTKVSRDGVHLTIDVVVQFLAVPRTYWVLDDSIQLGRGNQRWVTPATVDEAVPVMDEVAGLAQEEALPFFDRRATMDGRLTYLSDRVAELDARLGDGGWQDVNLDEELAYVHLLRGDLAEAFIAANWVDRAAQADASPHAVQTRDRVLQVMAVARDDLDAAVSVLRDQATHTAQALGLSAFAA